MEIILADSAGVCYGVSRALETVLEAAKNKNRPIFTLGPLIHNPQAIEFLESHGVKSVKNLDEIAEGSIVVMPTHGVPKKVMEQAESSCLEIIDATCPFVGKVHRFAESLANEGYQVVILGDSGHTEVQGILSRAGKDAIVVSDVAELDLAKLKIRVGLVAQTTQTIDSYGHLAEALCRCSHEVRAYNTICNATFERQKAVIALAEHVDVMVIVGGRISANTRRLAEICQQSGVPTYHIEVADEIEPDWFADAEKVGVSAGASTPDWLIKEVIEKIESIAEKTKRI